MVVVVAVGCGRTRLFSSSFSRSFFSVLFGFVFLFFPSWPSFGFFMWGGYGAYLGGSRAPSVVVGGCRGRLGRLLGVEEE